MYAQGQAEEEAVQVSGGQEMEVCRAHGVGGGAPRGPAHPNYRYGMRSREMMDVRRLASYLNRAAREHE